ncbi:hypothetical protein AB0E99_22715 [Streptomyces sp. NPDC030592]|uniref:hypothetical protein n=1 Tax=Streptomyces sp. NPDC030592 TaxID=3155365 RepID=UPI0033CD38BC
MSKQTGPACGNNPNHKLTAGDRQAVVEFRAYLTRRAALLEAAGTADELSLEIEQAMKTREVGPLTALQDLADKLRRMADKTPAAEAQPRHCTHCGQPISRVTGTLAAWWVHNPGGNTVCDWARAAVSTRATPPAAEAQQDETAATETQADNATLLELVRDFLDPDPCTLDHHGYCQAHGYLGGEPMSCPHGRATKLLAELEQPAVGARQDGAQS